MKMYKPIEIRHDTLLQCYGNCVMMKESDYLLEIDILINSLQKHLVVLSGVLGVQKL